MVHHDFPKLHSSLLKFVFPKNFNYHPKNAYMINMLEAIPILTNSPLLIMVSFYKL